MATTGIWKIEKRLDNVFSTLSIQMSLVANYINPEKKHTVNYTAI